MRLDIAIVDRRASHGLIGSRAGGPHSRTIEFFNQRGIAGRGEEMAVPQRGKGARRVIPVFQK